MTSKWPHNRSQVIWRSFCESKLKSVRHNRLSVKKNLWKNIWHAQKWDLVRKLHLQVTIGHLRSFRGHLEVIWWFETQIWCVQSTQSTKKPRKRHIACPKWDLAKKFCFEVTVGHLEVIWRSFGDSKLKSDKRNRLGVHKNLWKDILHAPKWDLVRKLCFQVLMGHLRSFRGHLEVI